MNSVQLKKTERRRRKGNKTYRYIARRRQGNTRRMEPKWQKVCWEFCQTISQILTVTIYIVWARLEKNGGTVRKSVLRSESAAKILSQISQIVATTRATLSATFSQKKLRIIGFKPSLGIRLQYTNDRGTVTESCRIKF